MPRIPSYDESLSYLSGVGGFPGGGGGVPITSLPGEGAPSSGGAGLGAPSFFSSSIGAGGGGAAGLEDAGSPASESGPPAATTPPPGFADTEPLEFGREGSVRDRTLGALASGIESSFDTLSGAERDFYSAAGERRGFGQAERSTLDLALQNRDLDPARALFAGYTGPTELGFSYNQGLQGLADALTNQRSLTEAARIANSALTPGMARWEARNLLQDPGYLSEAEALRGRVGEFGREVERANEEAAAYATGRQSDEAEVGLGARDYLNQRQEGILSTLDRIVNQYNQSALGFEGQYQDLIDSPTTGELQGLGLGDLATPEFQQQELANSVLDSINREFSDIEGLPEAFQGPGFDGSDRVQIMQDGRPYDLENLASGQLTAPGISQEQAQRMLARYTSLNNAFGSLTGRSRTRDIPRGAFELYNPTTFPTVADDTPLPAVQEFIDYDPGVLANRANIGRTEDYGRLQDIASLLGAEPALVAAPEEEAYRAPSVSARSEDFQRALLQALAQRERDLRSEERSYVVPATRNLPTHDGTTWYRNFREELGNLFS